MGTILLAAQTHMIDSDQASVCIHLDGGGGGEDNNYK